MPLLTAPENTLPDPDYLPNGYANTGRTWMEGFHAQVTESFNTTAIGPQLWREADRQLNNTSSPLLSREQANEQYGIPDVLQFDQPINAESAAERQRLVQDQMRRQSIVDRSSVGTIGRLSASLIGGAADPVNIAFAVAPEALLARVGGLGRGAALSLGERVAFGAASGSLGNAVLTPAQAYFAGQEGREYGIGEALADITLGAAIGGAAPIVGKGLSVLRNRWMRDATRVVDAMHSVGEPSSNPTRLANSTTDARLESLSTVLQQKLMGLPADLSATIQTLDVNARALGEVDQAISVASIRAAQALRASVGGDLTAAATRRAGFAPFGETGSRIGDTRIIVGWQSNDYGTVAPRDLERMSPLTQTMVPVEETADSATWRVRRAADGRTVEYRVQETAEGQKWSVTMAPKKAPLSRFIDDQAPADLQSAFTRVDDEAQTQSVAVRADANLKDPDELLRSYAGQTFRAGEQMPAAYDFRYTQQPASIGDPSALQDLAAMQQIVDEAPPVPRSVRDEGQVLGQGTAATRELDEFAKEDLRRLDELIKTQKAARMAPTDPKAFDTWFQGSKVVDENGAPKRVFHGTGQTFQEFNKAFLGTNTGASSAKRGFFFSDNAALAFSYADASVEDIVPEIPLLRFLAEGANPHWTKADIDAAASQLPSDIGMNIRPVYLSLKMPKIVDLEGKAVTHLDQSLTSFVDEARAAGHDGLILKNARDPGSIDIEGADAPSTIYIVFDPEDIRSTFDTGTGAHISDADQVMLDEIDELETHYKEIAETRSRAVTCFMMEGNG